MRRRRRRRRWWWRGVEETDASASSALCYEYYSLFRGCGCPQQSVVEENLSSNEVPAEDDSTSSRRTPTTPSSREPTSCVDERRCRRWRVWGDDYCRCFERATEVATGTDRPQGGKRNQKSKKHDRIEFFDYKWDILPLFHKKFNYPSVATCFQIHLDFHGGLQKKNKYKYKSQASAPRRAPHHHHHHHRTSHPPDV